MRALQTKIEGVLIIEPSVFEDERGWFLETYNKKNFKDMGIDVNFVQDNHSFTAKKGTIRGLHLQNKPFTQTKLIRCLKGVIRDVIVDLRKGSPTYKEWISVELAEKNRRMLFVPKGFAHGFMSLTEKVEVEYKVDDYYDKGSERTIRFNDPEIGIEWGETDLILSDRDRNAPFLKDCDINF